jgi:bifunctional DNA-binding transcriptional regulator/antitoxin component of YhaV-PrlF toxin-antitoxin module
MTIPKRIRQAAGLAEGDVVIFEPEGGWVRFRKVSGADAAPGQIAADDLAPTPEWNSTEDVDAWRDL